MMKKVFEYNNYRRFIRDFYLYKKSAAKGFTYRYFARKAGFVSPVFIKLVIEGKSNLSSKSTSALIKAMELSLPEAHYFENLVKFNQANTESKKDKYFQILRQLNQEYGVTVLQADQYEYYSKWYNSVLREIAPYVKNKRDIQKLGSLLLPHLNSRETEKAIELLKRCLLLREDPDGTFSQTKKIISTGTEIESLAVRKLHIQMALLAAEAIEHVPKDERDVSGLTIGVSQEILDIIKTRIMRFREEIMMLVASDKRPVERVYRLNFQLFPVSLHLSQHTMDSNQNGAGGTEGEKKELGGYDE